MSGPLLPSQDLYLFNEGTHYRLHEYLGAHLFGDGVRFAVWAPNARAVRVVGDFDGWGGGDHHLEAQGTSGIWAGIVPAAEPGHMYGYRIETRTGETLEKTDPVAAGYQQPPATAAIVTDLSHQWGDAEWMAQRGRRVALDAPISIYEVHLGSWGRALARDGERFPGYRDMAPSLADHALAHGFTHVELLPIMEHPFYGSWGYQTTGYFAPTARYGSPTDFMAFVDHLHQAGVGVILDWVPSHFPSDWFGLARFDGTHLYEHADRRLGWHPDWDSAIFNYGRHEVRAFLVSSAMCWLERYHADGLRVDAVASMLYRDYSRADGEWLPNEFGGRENLEAIAFLRQLNEAVFGEHPDVTTFAEESTAWPMVSRPTYVGGLGFGYKWDMGWMHDTLAYFSQDPVHRRWHHHQLTFRAIYAFSENYALPLSHDEVVHGKGSLLAKMPGDDWQRHANLRLLYGWQWAQPGKKLLFMGGELAQWHEWAHETSIAWDRHDDPAGTGVRLWVTDLNHFYARSAALHATDADPRGFRWIVADDNENSVYAFLRRSSERDDADVVVAVFNATPVPRHNYRVGVPTAGRWQELLNSDAHRYGGSGVGNGGIVETAPIPGHGFYHSLNLTLPPLAVLLLGPVAGDASDG
jgi:1,4-alpha-glucan branching enzyme